MTFAIFSDFFLLNNSNYLLIPIILTNFVPKCSNLWQNKVIWSWLSTLPCRSSTDRIFDFEGSMVPSIARSYREFGG